MRFSISRESLLAPLQLVATVVERRQTLPILANILLVVDGQQLSLSGTDLEVELIGRVALEGECEPGEATVSAHKLMDICNNLPNGTQIDLSLEGQKITVKAGRSRFSLVTLPAHDFPALDEASDGLPISLLQSDLRHLLERSQFAMAQQDVRYYLNGMLLEVRSDLVRSVATDGHRMAMCSLPATVETSEVLQVIVPSKGVAALIKLLSNAQDNIHLTIGKNHIRASTGAFSFTSKLVDGKFPEYERVIPKGGDKQLLIPRQALSEALKRTAILSNEKFRGVRLLLSNGLLKLQANNPEHEEAEEELSIDYSGDALEIGFNEKYMQQALAVMESQQVQLLLSDSNSSALLQEAGESDSLYVIMPMRI